ncbi:hypothetical protein F4775DRAFT_542618 [Biscogniauxia sp. FL1348]|nr:hypothetical protein F4775DRAFT_542618 [Biscogniauxia sp. FL1348]
MPPSGTEAAKQKFQEGVEKTRQPADVTKPGVNAAQRDNPKLMPFGSQIAKGDTEASWYTAKGGPSGTARTKEPGGL